MEKLTNYDDSLRYPLRNGFAGRSLLVERPKTQMEQRKTTPLPISFDNFQAQQTFDYNTYQYNGGVFEIKDQEFNFAEKANQNRWIIRLSPIEKRVSMGKQHLKPSNNENHLNIKNIIEKSLKKARKAKKLKAAALYTVKREKMDPNKTFDSNRSRHKKKKSLSSKNDKNNLTNPYRGFLNRIPTLNNPYKRASKSRSGSLCSENLNPKSKSYRESLHKESEKYFNGVQEIINYLPYPYKRAIRHRDSKESVFTDSSEEDHLLNSKLNP
ncbi:unnamed protein product [Blepharisma stoltei]|uniref:Uncharacterized protein n=1 Tax=Blepharisma stoltei TaxID=1481888 RepID=A0AAU9JUV0_9CILI|nr:unnamed protein product [Blepharisma stoltei]